MLIREGETCEETGTCTPQGICENGQGPTMVLMSGGMNGGMNGEMNGGMMGGLMGGMMGGMMNQDQCDQGFNWQYNPINQKCEGQTGLNECEFFIVKEMNPWTSGGEVSCNHFCTARGGRCVQGYHNMGNQCGRGNSHSCDDTFNSSICLCTLP